MKFKVGDLVQYQNTDGDANYGEIGKVARVNNSNSIGVIFEKYDKHRHNLEGLCQTGYGWNVQLDDIKPYKIKSWRKRLCFK